MTLEYKNLLFNYYSYNVSVRSNSVWYPMLRIISVFCLAVPFVLAQEVSACDEHAKMHGNQEMGVRRASDVNSLAGEICYEYQYTSEANRRQTLGRLHTHNHDEVTESAGIHDVEPVVGELVRPKVAVKEKHQSRKHRKQIVKRPVEKAPQVSEKKKEVRSSDAVVKAPIVEEAPKAQDIVKSEVGEVVMGGTKEEPVAEDKKEIVVDNSVKPVEIPVTEKEILQESVVSNDSPENQPSVVEQRVQSENSNQPIHGLAQETLNFYGDDIELTQDNVTKMNSMIAQMKADPNKNIKVYSYSYSSNGDLREGRRISLMRAIKIRKFLIDNEIMPNRITVKAIDDSDIRYNKVDVEIENSF